MMEWCCERGLKVGEALVFEKIAERTYRPRLERGGAGEA
jgi:hypothetical protein